MKRLLVAGAMVFASFLPAAAQQATDPQNTIYLDTKDGRITIQLRPDLAPQAVARMKQLTRDGRYAPRIGSLDTSPGPAIRDRTMWRLNTV